MLSHADPHHRNLLLGSTRTAPGEGPAGGGVWLVDWDDAVLAPREADLVFGDLVTITLSEAVTDH